MYNTSVHTDHELPATGRLIQSTVIALLTAGILLATVVMPAEYGIDPTGLGEITGLKRMGEIKVSLAKEAAADRADDAVVDAVVDAQPLLFENGPAAEAPPAKPVASAPAVESAQSTMNHEMQVTLAPDQGTEIKVTMTKGSKVQYAWETDGGNARFDLHGDSKRLKINYHSYSKGAGQQREGILKAAFDGDHGWFWRNRTAEPMTITLTTDGEYTDIKQFK